jgi:hypothetical protein
MALTPILPTTTLPLFSFAIEDALEAFFASPAENYIYLSQQRNLSTYHDPIFFSATPCQVFTYTVS